MVQKVIGIGTALGDGTGDVGRTAFSKVNDNFTDVYSQIANYVQIPTAIAATYVATAGEIAVGAELQKQYREKQWLKPH